MLGSNYGTTTPLACISFHHSTTAPAIPSAAPLSPRVGHPGFLLLLLLCEGRSPLAVALAPRARSRPPFCGHRHPSPITSSRSSRPRTVCMPYRPLLTPRRRPPRSVRGANAAQEQPSLCESVSLRVFDAQQSTQMGQLAPNGRLFPCAASAST